MRHFLPWTLLGKELFPCSLFFFPVFGILFDLFSRCQLMVLTGEFLEEEKRFQCLINKNIYTILWSCLMLIKSSVCLVFSFCELFSTSKVIDRWYRYYNINNTGCLWRTAVHILFWLMFAFWSFQTTFLYTKLKVRMPLYDIFNLLVRILWLSMVPEKYT